MSPLTADGEVSSCTAGAVLRLCAFEPPPLRLANWLRHRNAGDIEPHFHALARGLGRRWSGTVRTCVADVRKPAGEGKSFRSSASGESLKSMVPGAESKRLLKYL